MSIFTKMLISSPDPVIAYSEVVWYKEPSNEYENMSGLTIQGLKVYYNRNFKCISIPFNDLLKVSGIWNSCVTTQNATDDINTPHVIFGKSQLNQLILKFYIWRFFLSETVLYVENKNGKIEVNKSVIPTCGIHHLFQSFEQCDNSESLYAFKKRAVKLSRRKQRSVRKTALRSAEYELCISISKKNVFLYS